MSYPSEIYFLRYEIFLILCGNSIFFKSLENVVVN